MNTSDNLSKSDRVVHKEHPEFGFGRVRSIQENVLDDSFTYDIDFEWVPGPVSTTSSVLEPIENLTSYTDVESSRFGVAATLRHRLGCCLAFADNSQTGSFLRSFTKPLPHQAYLLDKLISKNQIGHIIADDVGMGKTVEAGLMIASHRQNNPRARVLVMCPAGVVLQWQDEMEEHFGLLFSIAGRDFRVRHKTSWQNSDLVLISVDTIKQEQHRDLLLELPSFDLIVCDEAHRLTAKRDFFSNELTRTQSFRFIEWLVENRVVKWVESSDGTPRSPNLLLLTATPHQGDDIRFFYLLHLVRPDLVSSEDISSGVILDSIEENLTECITRTAKKRAVDWDGTSIFKGHESKTFDVELSDPELEILSHLSTYVMQHMTFANSGEGDQLIRALAMHTFQKIAASSWVALENALSSRLGASNVNEDLSSELESLFENELAQNEREFLEILLARIRALKENSKWNVFAKLLESVDGFRANKEPILIFTQYRATQDWLASELTKNGENVATINGSMNLDERKRQRAHFDSTASIMVSTEAGSEGANMHRRCHLEINFDLPWNPMRLLQRIGRLDRYGQKHIVKVINLRSPSSWDSQISDKIAEKLERIQENMGAVADEDYHNMILGEVHEAVNVHKIMAKAKFKTSSDSIDSTIDSVLRKILQRKETSSQQLYSGTLGMPEGFDRSRTELTPTDFKNVFAWSAESQNVKLMETRTSEKKYVPEVYHFKLPKAFKSGLRASNDVYKVFDRDVFAKVRHEIIGTVRGQVIAPTLAGFGDKVTDWFFRKGVEAKSNASYFQFSSIPNVSTKGTWWITYVMRWQNRGAWVGPDAQCTIQMNSSGSDVLKIPTSQIMQALYGDLEEIYDPVTTPNLDKAQSLAKEHFKQIVPSSAHLSTLALFPVSMVCWG